MCRHHETRPVTGHYLVTCARPMFSTNTTPAPSTTTFNWTISHRSPLSRTNGVANVKERYAGNLEHRDAAAAAREGIEFYASQLSHIGEELPAGTKSSYGRVDRNVRNYSAWSPQILTH